MFKLYEGVVEDVEDPLKLGRYRVRVFGVHTDNQGELPTNDLPWAITMHPTTSAATSGIGSNPSLLQGTWVICSFLDDELQKPIIFGAIAGIQGDTPFAQMDLAAEIEECFPPQLPPPNAVKMPNGEVKQTSEVTSLPSGATIIEQPYIGSLTKSQVSKLKEEIAKHESQGRCPNGGTGYTCVNTLGFLGKYQFGTEFLEDMGYIVKGSYARIKRHKEVLSNDANWTGKDGIKTQEAFLHNLDVQEKCMDAMLKRNYSSLCRAGVASQSTPPEKLAGLLCAAHLKGAGGAIAYARGKDSTDAYGTSASKYYQYGYSCIVGVGTVEAPTPENINEPAVDKNINNPHTDARKYDTGAKAPKYGKQGFVDPSGKYPLKSRIDESDLNRLARASKITQTIVGEKEADLVRTVPVANSGITWRQSPVPYNARYPKNHVFASESGHIMEFDDTEGSERINLHHMSGTFSEIDSDGNKTDKVKGTKTIIVEENELVYIKGSGHVCVDGDISLRVGNVLQIEVMGNANIKVNGNMTQEVMGNYSLNVHGSMAFNCAGAASLTAGTFSLTAGDWSMPIDPIPGHSYVLGTVSTGGGSLSSVPSYSPSIKIPAPVTRQESVDMALEDDTETTARIYSNEPPAVIKQEDTTPANLVVPVLGTCGFTELSNELQLTANYKLKDLCRDGGFNFNGQHGLKAEELACNLKQLCINVIEPLREKYSHLGFKVNSGFRPAGSGVSKAASGHVSQHELGQAVDISFSKVRGLPNDREEFYKLAQEIKNTVPFDQLLLEFRGSSSVWIHISFKTDSLRRQVLTMNNDKTYSQGLVLVA